MTSLLTLLTVVTVLSGVIGRYIYTAVPRTLEGVELSVAELCAEEGCTIGSFYARFWDVRPALDFPFVLTAAPDGVFETGHLWFLVCLLGFSLVLRALRRFPILQVVPARVVGVGLFPEHVRTPAAGLSPNRNRVARLRRTPSS